MKLSELQEEFWRKEHEVTEERLVRGALILTILSAQCQTSVDKYLQLGRNKGTFVYSKTPLL